MPLLLWMMEGLVAGWLTGKIMEGEGRDRVMNLVMGVAGAVAGGFLVNVAPFLVQGRMIFTNLAAVLGAVILTVFFRYVGGSREYGSTD